MDTESSPRDTALAARLHLIYAGWMDSPCTLPNCFPVASFGKATGADQKNLLCKYLCNCLRKKIAYANDFDFTNGISLANLRARVQNQSIV